MDRGGHNEYSEINDEEVGIRSEPIGFSVYGDVGGEEAELVGVVVFCVVV